MPTGRRRDVSKRLGGIEHFFPRGYDKDQISGRTRDRVVFTAADDGMLHAFTQGSGTSALNDGRGRIIPPAQARKYGPISNHLGLVRCRTRRLRMQFQCDQFLPIFYRVRGREMEHRRWEITC